VKPAIPAGNIGNRYAVTSVSRAADIPPPLAPPQTGSLQPGDLVSPAEAVAILGTAPRTLHNWRSQGIGPAFVRVGLRMVRYKRADLAAFIGGVQ
jgi:hypothetical protein